LGRSYGILEHENQKQKLFIDEAKLVGTVSNCQKKLPVTALIGGLVTGLLPFKEVSR
jgi:hypothetical protein